MRRLGGRSIVVVLALGLLALAVLPARASNTLVHVDGPGSLAIPATAVPAGYTIDSSHSGAITRQSLLPTLGKHVSSLFQRDGWVTGYHGWLNATDLTYKAFVTYDFYGFKTANGAEVDTGYILGLALGVQTPTAQGRLPTDAEVFVDSTGEFGPELTHFVAVEIVFRVQNVIADVTGYYEGGDSTTIDAATNGAIQAASSIDGWLASSAGNARQSALPPLMTPLIVSGFWPGRRRR